MPVPACAHVGLPSSGPVEHGESQALADSPARSALVHSLMQATVRMSPLLAAAAVMGCCCCYCSGGACGDSRHYLVCVVSAPTHRRRRRRRRRHGLIPPLGC